MTQESSWCEYRDKCYVGLEYAGTATQALVSGTDDEARDSLVNYSFHCRIHKEDCNEREKRKNSKGGSIEENL